MRKGSKHTEQLYVVIECRRKEIDKIATVFGLRRGAIDNVVRVRKGSKVIKLQKRV